MNNPIFMEVAMKWLLTLLALILFATPAMSQNERKVLIKGEYGVDTYQVFYASGELKEEATIVNGQRHGEYRFYDQDGRLLVETEYRKGKEHGIRKVFNMEGTMIAMILFKEGEKTRITLPYSDLKEALAEKDPKKN